MSETKPTRREKEREAQQREILAAALSLFAERCYHNVTMHEIAEKSEFAVGTLYKFFRNKEELYRTLILQSAAELFGQMQRALDEPEDEIEKLRNFVRVKRAISYANVPIIRLFFTETHGESYNMVSGLGEEIHRYHGLQMSQLTEIFASGIARGLFKPIAEPEYLAVALEGVTTAFFFRWLEDPLNNAYPENPDTTLNMLFAGLLKPQDRPDSGQDDMDTQRDWRID